MTQRELDRAVSRVLGESVAEVARRGFQLLTYGPVERDPEDLIVDWDEVQLRRNVATVEQRSCAAALV